MKYILVVLASLSLAGCGAISATTLRCGTDGESSYLELVSAPQQVAATARATAQMCGFAYQQEE